MLSSAKLRWMLYRLASMSSQEVSHRVGERIKREAGRKLAGWRRFDCTGTGFRTFDFCPDHLHALAHECSSDWAAVEGMTRAARWTFLGRTWPGATDGSTWHLDPVSGQIWPREPYCFDVDFRHQHRLGDVKYVWEVNRLQFLPPIAALSRTRGDPEMARFCWRTILNWADENPPFSGVNWASGIELALRAISLLATLSILGPQTLPRQTLDRIAAILNAHAVWLIRYPSRHSSANNHLVAEAAGLYVLGTLAPTLPDAARYKEYGRAVLIQEAQKQILADGVGAEQSPTYTAFTLELYGVALAAARSTGDEFPASVRERLSQALVFLRWITDQLGHQPRYGDDDEGRVFVSRLDSEPFYVSAVVNAIAGAIDRPDLAAPLATPHLRNALIGNAEPNVQLPTGLRSFDEGGYSVFRDRIGGRSVMLIFDHGPLGYLSIAAHGHADALSIWLHVDGQPVIADAGTYLYHAGGSDRHRYRGTGAHNTVQINAVDQSTISGAFNWSHKARAWRLPPSSDDTALQIAARHDGYVKRLGITHQRTVRQDPHGFVVSDILLGPLSRLSQAAIRYHLDPALQARTDEQSCVVLSRNGVDILSICVQGHDGQPLASTIVPSTHSPRFGVEEQTWAITAAPTKEQWQAGPILTRLNVL